jgi:hypothetical protein
MGIGLDDLAEGEPKVPRDGIARRALVIGGDARPLWEPNGEDVD